jgi:hypothetical protein
MRPLVLDDLLPLEEYAGRRREFFEAHRRYLDRYRRVRIGPRLTVIFENRQTLWFRVQELLRIARLCEAGRVQAELEVYNQLLPTRHQLQAALVLEISHTEQLAQELAVFQRFRSDDLSLCIGERSFIGVRVTCRPEDLAIGVAHWLRFLVPAADHHLLTEMCLPAHLQVSHPDYPHRSPPLSEEVRQSLAEDLELSDRD